jgi:hypothetical protein
MEYLNADGRELDDKFLALYSSSALVCNVFDYWRARPDIVGTCFELPSVEAMRFEQEYRLFDDLIPRYSANKNAKGPNVDVELKGSDSDNIVIECKFAEPFVKYASTRQPFTSTYFRPEAAPIWAGLDSTREFATRIDQGLEHFERLDPAQLIKTGAACQKRFGAGRWRFIYLWYKTTNNGTLTDDCRVLVAELARFRDLTRGELPLTDMNWQELFYRLEARSGEEDSSYCAYLRDRYFGQA